MSYLLAILFAIIGWFLMDSGQYFFAFLLFLAAVFSAFGSAAAKESPLPSAPSQQGTIVRASGTRIPSSMNIKIKDKWAGTTVYEDFGQQVASVVLLPVKVLARLFSGK